MKKLIQILLLLISFQTYSQTDLLNSLENEDSSSVKKEDVTASFKTTRIINGQSIEINHGGVLNFIIQHRFGQLSEGTYGFFGLDQATMRIAFEMGVSNRINFGIGRSTTGKVYDGFLKYKILKQKINGFPLTVTGFSSMTIGTLKWQDESRTNYFSSRLTFTNQLLIGSRITKSLSVQVSPTLIHKNLVASEADKNDIIAIGIGGRQKITKRLSINAEWYYVLPNQIADQYKNSLAIGVDIETGGHVFQLQFTNARQMNEKGFITETDADFFKGEIHYGFNLSRVFTMYKWKKNW